MEFGTNFKRIGFWLINSTPENIVNVLPFLFIDQYNIEEKFVFTLMFPLFHLAYTLNHLFNSNLCFIDLSNYQKLHNKNANNVKWSYNKQRMLTAKFYPSKKEILHCKRLCICDKFYVCNKTYKALFYENRPFKGMCMFLSLCTLPGWRPFIADGNEGTRRSRVHLYFFSFFTNHSFVVLFMENKATAVYCSTFIS